MSKQPAIVIPEGCERVLLHACCAPCSSAIVEWLLAHGVEPVIYYYNPNIYPFEEYEKRKNESKRHAESLGIRWIEGNDELRMTNDELRITNDELRMTNDELRMTNYELRMTNDELRMTNYELAHGKWLEAVKGLENEPERGKRCAACFRHRLQATARKAEELGIPFFATTLASSRWKNLEQINAAGREAEEKLRITNDELRITNYELRITNDELRITNDELRMTNYELRMTETRFWAQNWRKDGLQERRNELLKEYGFYNQTYCGCEYSRGER